MALCFCANAVIPSNNLCNSVSFSHVSWSLTYKVFLDVGTQTSGGIGTIIIEIRFALGQMDGTPDVKSSYKLITKDWSGLLGKFRK